MPKTAKPKPQTTLVTVAVTTAGPVSMKAVRELVGGAVRQWVIGWKIEGQRCTKVTVKRDANRER